MQGGCADLQIRERDRQPLFPRFRIHLRCKLPHLFRERLYTNRLEDSI
jgi:hypothetical protein